MQWIIWPFNFYEEPINPPFWVFSESYFICLILPLKGSYLPQKGFQVDLLCSHIIKGEWEYFWSDSCLECGNSPWERQQTCWNLQNKLIELENYETSDCCSFLQAFSIKIFECIQDLFQVSASKSLARRGRGEAVWFFFPTR